MSAPDLDQLARQIGQRDSWLDRETPLRADTAAPRRALPAVLAAVAIGAVVAIGLNLAGRLP